MKPFRRISIVFALCFATTAHAQMSFPTLTTNDLNGRSVTFPTQLPGSPTIVFIAYKQRQQASISAWIEKLGLQENSGPAWVEIPVIGRGASLMRSIIDNGMRSGIPSSAVRGKTFTVYSSRNAFNRALGISNTKQIYVALVDPDGTVYTLISGDVTDTKLQQLMAAYP